MTANERRTNRFTDLGKLGCQLGVYVDGKYLSRHIPWSNDKEAAKDFVFMIEGGFDVSPISDSEVTKDELKDSSKTRRFKYFAEHNLDEIIKFCTIKEGELEIDDKAFEQNACIAGLHEYLMKYYLDDICKSMESRNIKPVVTTTSSNSKQTTNSAAAAVNHAVPNRSFNTSTNTSNPIVIPPHYIPENAGFNSNGGFMIQDADGSFKPNFSTLLNPTENSARVMTALDGAEAAYNNNDLDSYKEYIKTVIQAVVNESLVGASDDIKAMLTGERLAEVMNKIYDEVLTGSIEDINRRLNDTNELNTFVMNALRDICSEVIAQESGLNVEEVKTAFDQAITEDSKSTVIINMPEEPAVLDDEPVNNTAIEEQYPVLKDIEKLITYNKAYGVKFAKDEYGLIQAAVFATGGVDDEAIEVKSFTMDLDGLIFNKDNKFWPGIEHTERPDFKRCYLLTTEMIVKFRDGKDLGEPLFGGSLPKLNKYVDIRTLFSLVDDNIDADLAQKVLVETKKAMMPNDRINKRFSKNRGIYTKASKMNETTFEFTIVFDNEYPRYVGGDPIKNTGGTGNLVVKVTTSEDNKATVTK